MLGVGDVLGVVLGDVLGVVLGVVLGSLLRLCIVQYSLGNSSSLLYTLSTILGQAPSTANNPDSLQIDNLIDQIAVLQYVVGTLDFTKISVIVFAQPADGNNPLSQHTVAVTISSGTSNLLGSKLA